MGRRHLLLPVVIAAALATARCDTPRDPEGTLERDDRDLTRRIAEATEALRGLDWRIHDVVIAPVEALDAD